MLQYMDVDGSRCGAGFEGLSQQEDLREESTDASRSASSEGGEGFRRERDGQIGDSMIITT